MFLHEWLARGIRLLRHLFGIDDPFANLGLGELGPDFIERSLLVALPGDGVTGAALVCGVHLLALSDFGCILRSGGCCDEQRCENNP